MKKITVVAAFSFAAMALYAEFSAGFARLDATPPLGVPIPGYFSKRIADGVLDPLVVECVAVSDGTNSALIYSVDNIHIDNKLFEKAFPKITAATGVPRDRLFIHSTHTHTGATTVQSDRYTAEENAMIGIYSDMMRTRLEDAGRLALAEMAPATIAVGKTVCRNISSIRRFRMKDGSVCTNPGIGNPGIKEPIGTPDETLQLIRFKRTGAPDIAIVNFGTHPDTVGGTKYSADWPGVVRSTFENGIGDGVKCLFINAAQGDVNHHDYHPTPGRRALKRQQIHFMMGRAVAGAAMAIWDVCDDIPAGEVRGIVAPVTMKANVPTEQEKKWVDLFDAGRKDEIPVKGMELKTITSPGSRVRKLRNGPETFDILVSSLAIGDCLAFAGVPGEPYVDIGRAIKAGSPFKTTFIACLTNGSEGYIPTTEAHSQGGYEALSSRFAAPTGDDIVAAQLSRLKELAGK